jgi:hypothetical protein
MLIFVILLPFPFTVCHSDSLHRSGTHAPASRIDDSGYLPLFATTIDGVVNLVPLIALQIDVVLCEK